MTAVRASLVLAICAVIASAAVRVIAHPAAASDVVLTWTSQRTVQVDLRTNAEALLVKLEVLGGEQRETADSSSLASRIAAFSDVLLASSSLRADGQPVSLAFVSVSPVESRAATVVVRLAGTLPADAGAVTWRTTLILGSYPFVIRGPGREPERYEWLAGPMESRARTLDAATAGAGPGLGTAIGLGFTHILPKGLDHILFVAGLCLLTGRLRVLLLQVSAFTVAHSATLALAMADVFSLPAGVVEPLIALSIVYIAWENLTTRRLEPRRLGLIFVFGLLHGLGFAGVLTELALPVDAFVTSLVGFNIGVELGQLSVIAVTMTCMTLARSIRLDTSRWVVQPASFAIGVIGAWWVVERLSGIGP